MLISGACPRGFSNPMTTRLLGTQIDQEFMIPLLTSAKEENVPQEANTVRRFVGLLG
jgi:hypothetical protein